MAQGQTQRAATAGQEASGHRRRGRDPARRLALAGGTLAAAGSAIGIALGLRIVIAAGIVVLMVAAVLLFAVANSVVSRYVERNLPAGGVLLLIGILGLLVAGLLEAAAPDSGRPLLLVLFGNGGLLAGAIAAGLLGSRFRTGIGERGFGNTNRFRWFDRSSPGFRDLADRVAMAQIGLLGLLALAVLWDDAGSSASAVTNVLAAVYAFGGLTVGGGQLVTVVMAGRGSARTRERIAKAMAELAPELLVHFSGGIGTLYQLEHWLAAIEATGRSWAIVFREPATYEAAVDVKRAVLIEDFGDLDLVMTDAVSAVLYVNTATKNNHAVRFGDPVHIQLHHGDSDKPPSSGKTMRLYDVHFVAGARARTRLENAGVASQRIFEVGRPVTDSLPEAGSAAPQTVLYAPTWEGAHADSNLSSLENQGEQIVRSLAATGRTFTFRPHPLSGTADAGAAAARRRVEALVDSLGGFVDTGNVDLVAAFETAGLLVCDVSSVLVDWYATGRPVLVTDVAGIGEDEVRRRYPTTSGARVIESPETVQPLVEEAFSSDPMRSERAQAAEWMLGEVGGAQARFDAALAAVIRPR